MRRMTWLLMVLMIMIGAKAQNVGKEAGSGKITGKITDSTSKKPMEYATITLTRKGSKKPFTGSTSNASGLFTLTGIDTGSYAILIESIGYQSFTIDKISIAKKNAAIDLKSISMQKSQQTLQNVTVVAQRGLIDNKIDKMVFNADRDLTSQGGAATDILRKVPQVSVDVDGNVELAGNSSIRFLINGKPSTAFGSNIADVLQSIPASEIKSVEVITSPGAKYDAQGMGGIINIILKQSTVKGINGNLSLTAGTRMENGSFNITSRQGNLGLNAFVSGNTRPYFTVASTSVRNTTDNADLKNVQLTQDGSSRVLRQGAESGVGFDWTYKKKNNFSGSVHYNVFGNNSTGLINQDQLTTSQTTGSALSNLATINRTGSSVGSHTVDVDLNYKRTFTKEDQELDISFNNSYGTNHGFANNYQSLLPKDSTYYGTNSSNPGTANQTELTVDYTQPLKKNVMLGIGGKFVSVDINSRADISSFQPTSKDYAYDSSLSNNLDYKRNIYALYAEISFPISTLFDVKVGSRYERTEVTSYFSNAQQQAIIPGYNTFVPSFFISKKLADGQVIKLGYSKRIERPDYNDLNPFVNTTDPNNISTGNPYLQPEIGHRIELSYSRNLGSAGNFMVSAFYRANKNDIQPYIVYYPSLKVGDSVYNNVSVNTRQNIGTEANTGINIFTDIRPTSKLDLRSNLSFYYRHTVNELDPSYGYNSFNYRLNLNASYRFSTNIAAEFFGNFSSARNEAQGKYPSFTTYSFAIRKQFWNKNGSLALTVTNPFNDNVNQHTSLFGPSFTVDAIRHIPFRSFGLNFTWKFGKLEFKKDKEEPKDPTVPEG